MWSARWMGRENFQLIFVVWEFGWVGGPTVVHGGFSKTSHRGGGVAKWIHGGEERVTKSQLVGAEAEQDRLEELLQLRRQLTGVATEVGFVNSHILSF